MGSTFGVPHRMWRQEEKLKIVLLHLDQNIPIKELSKQFGVNDSLLSVWCKQYKEQGIQRLKSQNGVPRTSRSEKSSIASDAARLHKNASMNMEEIMNCSAQDDCGYINQVIGNTIREYREKSGLSQSELAKKVGLSQQHISPVEGGKRSIGADRLYKIGSVLGFSFHDIQDRLDLPPFTIAEATEDSVSEIHALDSHITESKLISCINANHVLLLKISNAVIGVCRFSFWGQTIPFLEHLYIDEPYRGNGYGKELISHWESTIKKQGYPYVMCAIQENDSSRLFIEKIGYRSAGCFLPPEQDCEKIFYVKAFSK